MKSLASQSQNPISLTAERGGIFTCRRHRRGMPGRQAHCFAGSTQAAAAEHLHAAVLRCEHAPSVMEIFINNSMQQENEQTLKRARDYEEVLYNQRADSCRQTSEQPV